MPSSIRDTVPGAEEPASGASHRLEVTRLEGSREPPIPGADAACLEVSGRTQASPSCPVHTQITKTGLETAGLDT